MLCQKETRAGKQTLCHVEQAHSLKKQGKGRSICLFQQKSERKVKDLEGVDSSIEGFFNTLFCFLKQKEKRRYEEFSHFAHGWVLSPLLSKALVDNLSPIPSCH
jgi:hypothetical protein